MNTQLVSPFGEATQFISEAEIIANELTGENDWFEISKRTDLTVQQLREYKNHLYWPTVVRNNRNLPNDLLDEIVTEGKITLDQRSTWEDISKYHAADPEFIKKYSEQLSIREVNRRLQLKPSELAKLIKAPTVGMGATQGCGSDCYPYTVIEVNKQGTRIKVQSDNYKPGEGFDYYGNQVYEYTPNPEGGIDELRLNKFGEWVRVGGSTKYMIGFRRKYENPSF